MEGCILPELAREIAREDGLEDLDLGLLLEEMEGAPDTLLDSAGEGGAGRFEKRVGSMEVDEGRLVVGVAEEEFGLGFGERGVEARVDESGMIIVVSGRRSSLSS